jgi:quinohemoprotein ethanol dehydrogenase
MPRDFSWRARTDVTGFSLSENNPLVQTPRILGLAAIGLALAIAIELHSSADGSKAGKVTEARVKSEAADGTNWLLNGRTFDEKHFSPLQEITDKNVASLGLAWFLDIPGGMGVVAEPIVVDGVIYVSAPQSIVYAVDAASGKLLWKFDPHVRLNLAINGSYSARVNGGVAVWEGKVYVGTGDCRLIAVDASSGTQQWESAVCDATQTGITGAPHVAKGKIVMGYNGSDDGVRGALAAYDAETGKEVWRFWTVPGDPAKPFETKALEMAAKTWSGDEWWRIGGGDAWNAITYDDETGLVIFGTAGAGVDYGELSSVKVAGDKLFAGCIIALNADTGEYVWHFQTSAPGLQTENNHILVAALIIGGETRHVAITAPKNGFLYVLDVKTGKLLSAKPLVKTVWAKSIDLKTGRAVEIPKSAGGGRQWTVHNWWPMSYSSLTGLVYIPATDRRAGTKASVESGEGGEGLFGRLIAWDPVSQSARWSVEEQIATNGGVLSTAGNLVFQGQGTGEFAAYAADTGKKLWSVKTGSAIESVPVTFALNGEQYILTPVGWGSGSRLFAPARTMATPEAKRGPVRLIAFKLGTNAKYVPPPVTIPPVPKPPPQTADAATIRSGAALYEKWVCDGCHSPGTDGSGAWIRDGAVPDLRYMPPDSHRDWYAIVLAGSHRDQGMPGFADPPKFAFPNARMTPQDADAIHAYVIDQSWKTYRGEREKAHSKRENY